MKPLTFSFLTLLQGMALSAPASAERVARFNGSKPPPIPEVEAKMGGKATDGKPWFPVRVPSAPSRCFRRSPPLRFRRATCVLL